MMKESSKLRQKVMGVSACAMYLHNVFAQFPNTCGLKYQAPNSKFWRGVRRVGDSFFPPFASGWDGILFMLLFLEVLVGEKFVYFKY